MSATQPLPRVVLPRGPVAASASAKQTAKMPKLELESLLREIGGRPIESRREGPARSDFDALANAVEPPPSSLVFPLVIRKP